MKRLCYAPARLSKIIMALLPIALQQKRTREASDAVPFDV